MTGVHGRTGVMAYGVSKVIYQMYFSVNTIQRTLTQMLFNVLKEKTLEINGRKLYKTCFLSPRKSCLENKEFAPILE